MLLVKCPKCDASYKLSEDLYRRKAAGFGVVVTCRHCKTEIHVDEHGNAIAAPAESAPDATTEPPAAAAARMPPPIVRPPAAGTPADQTPIATPAAARAAAGPPRPNAAPPRPKTTAAPNLQTSRTSLGGLGPVMPSAPKLPVVPSVPAAPVLPSVPAVSAMPSLPATATAPSLPVRRPPTKPVAPGTARPRPLPPRQPTLIGLRPPKDEPSSPKLVALSQGLLGMDDEPTRILHAPQMPPPPPPVPPPPPPPPEDPVTIPPVRDPDAEPETQRPPPPTSADLGELEELDVPIATEDLPEVAPDSAASVDSQDFLEDLPKPKLPHAPPVRRMPGSVRAEAKDELPSATSAPKMEQLVHGPAVPLEAKTSKAPKKPAPAELGDDLFGETSGFDGAAPPLAPPDAGALTRAPVSSRAAAGASAANASSPAKSAAEKRSKRGLVWVLGLAGLGLGGFLLRDRLHVAPPAPVAVAEPPKESAPATEPAPTIPPVIESAEPPLASAEPVASTAPPVAAEPAPTTAAATLAPTAAPTTAPAPTTALAPTTKPTSAPAPATPTPASPGTARTPSATPTTASTGTPTAAPTPKPAPTAKPQYEAAGTVGTEPFDSAAARTALDAAAAQASACRKEGDPSGVAVVTITYSPTGRVTSANIGGPPFAATPTGGCIASTMRKARVPPFAGDMVTVRKTITVR